MAENSENFILMHKNIPVVEIKLDTASYYILAIGSIYNESHVPVGILIKKGELDRGMLNGWWRGRAIPASRQGINDALLEMNLSTTEKLLEKCMGLSLSDHYWICPKNSDLNWESINFFENSFSEDVGNILFGEGSSETINLMSPDNTSDGWLKKKWKIINGKRCLIKGGSGVLQQEPYNEVIACIIMKRLNIPHIPYTLTHENDYPLSVCENFISTGTELISAWYVMQLQKKLNHVSVYQHYLNCCDALGIPNMEQSINQMIVLDFLIMNEDRHQNNFGVIRNAETLEWLGAAPIFDSGTSLWLSTPNSMITSTSKIKCKPFKTTHDEQIKLVTSFDWLNLSALEGVDEEVKGVFHNSLFVDIKRADIICSSLNERIKMLLEIVRSHSKDFAVDDTSKDVNVNVANSDEDNSNH